MSFYCIRVVVPIFVWGGAALTGGGVKYMGVTLFQVRQLF